MCLEEICLLILEVQGIPLFLEIISRWGAQRGNFILYPLDRK